jgi:hypothetical protein
VLKECQYTEEHKEYWWIKQKRYGKEWDALVQSISQPFEKAVLPLYDELMPRPEIRQFLAALSKVGILQLNVDDAALRTWKSVLPAMIKRCRANWAHREDCAYVVGSEQRIPLSVESGALHLREQEEKRRLVEQRKAQRVQDKLQRQKEAEARKLAAQEAKQAKQAERQLGTTSNRLGSQRRVKTI